MATKPLLLPFFQRAGDATPIQAMRDIRAKAQAEQAAVDAAVAATKKAG